MRQGIGTSTDVIAMVIVRMRLMNRVKRERGSSREERDQVGEKYGDGSKGETEARNWKEIETESEDETLRQ